MVNTRFSERIEKDRKIRKDFQVIMINVSHIKAPKSQLVVVPRG
jgi:hypothetical protein